MHLCFPRVNVSSSRRSLQIPTGSAPESGRCRGEIYTTYTTFQFMKGNSMKTVSRLCVPIRFNEKFATAAMLLALAVQSALLAQSEKATEIKIQADQVTG